jgi:hypothetical protein
MDRDSNPRVCRATRFKRLTAPLNETSATRRRPTADRAGRGKGGESKTRFILFTFAFFCRRQERELLGAISRGLEDAQDFRGAGSW